MKRSIAKRILVVFLSLLIVAILLASTIKTHKVGKVTYCTHGEIIKDDTKTAIAFSLKPLTNEVVRLSDICPKHKKFDELYEKALAAFTKGDAVNGANYIKKLKRMDAKFSPKSLLGKATDAFQRQVAQQGPVAPVPIRSTNIKPDPTKRDLQLNPPVPFRGTDLSVLLPKTLPGYKMNVSEPSKGVAYRSFRATYQSKINSFIATVRQYPNETKAKDFENKVQKVLYKYNVRSTKFRGQRAYFGTNSTNYASLTWTVKKFSFNILVISVQKAKADLLKDALYIANYFPNKGVE